MKLLVVEDEKALRESIVEWLKKEAFVVEEAGDFQKAMEKIALYQYDCILVDIMLPGGNGLDLIREVKKLGRGDGLLIISAKNATDDKVLGLELGADDYLTKPFHFAELNARIKSVIRRHRVDKKNEISVGNILINTDERKVLVENAELDLNRKEYDLLYYFALNFSRVISKLTLAESVWGDNIDQADNLDFLYSQVKNLRKKLKNAGATAEIKVVYGFGYKFL